MGRKPPFVAAHQGTTTVPLRLCRQSLIGIRQPSELRRTVPVERGPVHQRQPRRLQFREPANGRHGGNADARRVERLLGDQRWLDNVLAGQRRAIAKMSEQIAAKQRLRSRLLLSLATIGGQSTDRNKCAKAATTVYVDPGQKSTSGRCRRMALIRCATSQNVSNGPASLLGGAKSNVTLSGAKASCGPSLRPTATITSLPALAQAPANLRATRSTPPGAKQCRKAKIRIVTSTTPRRIINTIHCAGMAALHKRLQTADPCVRIVSESGLISISAGKDFLAS